MALLEIFQNAVEKLCALGTWNWLLIFGVLVYLNWRRTPHPKFPPGPKGIPLLGVVPFLSSLPVRDFKKWSLKYGPVMSVRFGSSSVVTLNSYDAINQALVKQGNTFSDRPWIEMFAKQTNDNGIIFKKYSEDFKAQKHFALAYLREHGLAKKKMESVIGNESELFVKYLEQLQNSDKQVDLQHKLYQATSNVISQTIIGTRAEYGDPSFNKLLHALTMLFADPEHAARQGLIFIWNSLTKLPYFRESLKAFEKNMEYILSEMQRNIKEHERKFDPENIENFIDAFLYVKKCGTQPNKQGFTDDQLATVCRDFFMAGTETSSTFLSWLFVFYINFPEHQNNIDKEINDVLGSSGIPTIAKRAEMPFTCAFIQEGMRHQPIAPIAQHATNTDVELQGFVLPKETVVLANLHGAHFDPDDWPNPEKFDPYRHIDENGKFVFSNKVIPFGIGSRFCLGESLARVEIFIFFVKVVQRFHVRSARDYPPPLDNPLVSAVVSPRECVVKLTVRN